MYFRVRKNLAWQQIDGEVVIVDLDRGVLLGLSPGAAPAFLEVAAAGGWVAAANDEGEASLVALAEAGLLEAAPALDSATVVGRVAAEGGKGEQPVISWREALATFAKACLFQPGNDLCNAGPAS